MLSRSGLFFVIVQSGRKTRQQEESKFLNTYQDQEIIVGTRGTYVNQYGQVIEPEYNEAGELNKGFNQLDWYQNIPLTSLDSQLINDKCANVVYTLLAGAMTGYENRKSV